MQLQKKLIFCKKLFLVSTLKVHFGASDFGFCNNFALLESALEIFKRRDIPQSRSCMRIWEINLVSFQYILCNLCNCFMSTNVKIINNKHETSWLFDLMYFQICQKQRRTNFIDDKCQCCFYNEGASRHFDCIAR